MKILFDTNVLLDVYLDRQPFADDAAFLLALVEKAQITGYLCATTITTIYYLLKKALGERNAIRHLKDLMALFEIAPVTRAVLQSALNAGFSDYEDAVLYESARQMGVNYIVTRNVKDFKRSDLPVFDPTEFMAMLKLLNQNSE